MEIMIIGTGKVGTNLAEALIDAGETISIIEPSADKLLNVQHIDCTKVQGVPFEIDVLERAGIKNVDAVVCVSDNENSNVLVGQMVKNIYDIEKVIIRISNPNNESIYQAMGLQTVSTTTMTIERVLFNLGFAPSTDLTTILGYPIAYDLRRITDNWDGVTVNELERNLGVHILAVLDGKKLNLVARDYVLKENQEVIIVSLPEQDQE